MTNVNWAVASQIAKSGHIAATRVVDATPVVGSAYDLRTAHGARPTFVLTAFETNTLNTGGTWTVEESATSGGAYTTTTAVDPALTATPAEAGNNVQVISVRPNPDKPWIRARYVGADANTEVDVTATLLLLPRVVG